MADFACVLQAVDKVTRGWDTLGAYAAAADTIAADVLEGDPFGKAVAVMVREQPGQTWTGTAGELPGTDHAGEAAEELAEGRHAGRGTGSSAIAPLLRRPASRSTTRSASRREPQPPLHARK